MRILAQTYKKEQPPVSFVVFPSLGSSGGIKALRAGELDLAISSRPLRPAEREQGLQETELCKTPFVFITNTTVAQSSIITRELEQIYNGRLTSWPDGSRIRIILRPQTETDTEIVMGLSPGMNEALTAAKARPGMILAVTDQENLTSMGKTPGALGGGTLTQILSEKRRVNILKLNGLTPSVEALKEVPIPYPMIGGLAAWIAGLITKGGGSGILGNIVAGVIGAALGGWIFDVLNISVGRGKWVGPLVTATVGAVVLLFAVGLFRKK